VTTGIIDWADLLDVTYDDPPHWEIQALVDTEVQRQDERWGVQSHPLIGGSMPWVLRGSYEHFERQYQRVNAQRVEANTLGWDTILLEEVYEALSEKDPEKQIAELVQVAAVAVQAALAIKRAQ
jgi:hypothetical protein